MSVNKPKKYLLLLFASIFTTQVAQNPDDADQQQRRFNQELLMRDMMRMFERVMDRQERTHQKHTKKIANIIDRNSRDRERRSIIHEQKIQFQRKQAKKQRSEQRKLYVEREIQK